VHLGPFGRFLAKIAHAEAVRLYGLDNFMPVLPEMILGKDDQWPYFIGRPIQDDFEDVPKSQCWIRLYHHPQKNSGIILARIRLFVQLQGPVYDIVVGKPRLH
jgi:hypothetical protein